MESVLQNPKIVFLGPRGAGKSSLIQRFTDPDLNQVPSPTKATHRSILNCPLESGIECTIEIMEVCGDDRFMAMAPIYYRDARIGVFVYDHTDYESFEQMKLWVKNFWQNAGINLNLVQIVIVANKVDNPEDMEFSPEVQQFARSVNAKLLHCTATTTTSVQHLFQQIFSSLQQNNTANLDTFNRMEIRELEILYEIQRKEQKRQLRKRKRRAKMVKMINFFKITPTNKCIDYQWIEMDQVAVQN